MIITNALVVSPDRDEPVAASIAVDGGKITAVGDVTGEARVVHDAGGKLAFPGVVDAHQHWGIYNPLSEDAETESRACAQGGVTSGLTYFRTGQYYLNRSGPYEDMFPDVLAAVQGRAHVDYGFHVAPILRQHIDEIPLLVERHGVTSFKIFMFYGGHGLHGSSDDQAKFLMTPPDEPYNIAHFEFVMRGIEATRRRFPELADRISLSLHCETAEIMRAYTDQVMRERTDRGLRAYSDARPPHSEGLAVTIASYLAHETGLPTINLLHLSSAKAFEAAMLMKSTFPHVDFRREVTIGHLLTDVDTAPDNGAKVNPPIRPREDVEALWEHVLAGNVDWVVSDHACCREEVKFGGDRDDVFVGHSGFGGTEYLLPGLVTEGTRRGLSLGRVAALVADNPARRYGLTGKGRIAEGYDADVALVDPRVEWTVRAADSESTQGYTPFEGFDMTAKVTDVFLRGEPILADGAVTGSPRGRYLPRN
ncbi:allantoinase [Dactylosporangium salmoneum]|uniref:Allantoinase n=1 Tax=Dactylosporangium salmoneum TaxID=53361 RepID=A0ABN3HS65_9ACTN